MRKVLYAIAVLASSFTLLHCAGNATPAEANPQPSQNDNVVQQKDAGVDAAPAKDAAPPTTPPGFDASAPKDAGPDVRPPPPADAAPPPPPEQPGPACVALNDCCTNLTDSITAAGCFLLVGKKNEYLCAGGFATFNCTAANAAVDIGPNCAQLSACCNSNQYIQNDTQCTSDWQTQNEDLCSQDLAYYQSDPFGDCK